MFGGTGRWIKPFCMTLPDFAPVCTQWRQLNQWSATVLPSYSPDLAPSDFKLSGNLTDSLRRHRFANDEPKHSMFQDFWRFNKCTRPAYDVWRDIGNILLIMKHTFAFVPVIIESMADYSWKWHHVIKHGGWSQRPLPKVNKPLPPPQQSNDNLNLNGLSHGFVYNSWPLFTFRDVICKQIW